MNNNNYQELQRQLDKLKEEEEINKINYELKCDYFEKLISYYETRIAELKNKQDEQFK